MNDLKFQQLIDLLGEFGIDLEDSSPDTLRDDLLATLNADDGNTAADDQQFVEEPLGGFRMSGHADPRTMAQLRQMGFCTRRTAPANFADPSIMRKLREMQPGRRVRR